MALFVKNLIVLAALGLCLFLMTDAASLDHDSHASVSGRRIPTDALLSGYDRVKELSKNIGSVLPIVASNTPNVMRCHPKDWIKCESDPCQTTHCTNVRGAVCLEEHCGGCFAKYFTVSVFPNLTMSWTDVTSNCR